MPTAPSGIRGFPALPSSGAVARFRTLRAQRPGLPTAWALNIPSSRGLCYSRGVNSVGAVPLGAGTGSVITGGTIASAGSSRAGDCLSLTTGTATGSTSYAGTAADVGCWRHNLFGLFPIETGGTTANVRIWCGFTSASAMPSSDTLVAGIGAAFRFSTVAGDTTWKFCTSNGSNQTATDTLVTFEASKTYALYIGTTDAGATIDWAIDDITTPSAVVSYSGSVSATLPGVSTYMRAISHVETRATPSGSRSIVTFGIDVATTYAGLS